MMTKKALPIITCGLAGLLCAGPLAADWHGHLPGFFEDNFDRVDSETIGDGWVESKGSWSLIDEQAIPTNDAIEEKILAFEDVEPVEYPFVISGDMAGLSSGRWAGIAFHIQDSSYENFYSLIARVENTSAPGQSAIQFRRYNWGNGTVLASHILPEDLTLGDFFRYSVVSKQPGHFELMVDKLDQETGEVMENLITFTVSETEFSGGRAGFHSNAGDDRVAFNRFLINSQELTEVVADAISHNALEVSYTPEPGRVTLLQSSSDLIDWNAITLPDTSKGQPRSKVLSMRFTDREFFRVVSDL